MLPTKKIKTETKQRQEKNNYKKESVGHMCMVYFGIHFLTQTYRFHLDSQLQTLRNLKSDTSVGSVPCAKFAQNLYCDLSFQKLTETVRLKP